ncbi:MAG: ATP-binding cassette domain-containing protein [Cuniculiplasma sp.]
MIEINSLSKIYKNNTVYENCSFNIPEGKTLLIGPNGIGKTTLLSMIYGYRRPSSGNIKVFSLDSVGDIQEIRERVSYIPADGNLPLNLKFNELLEYVECFVDRKKMDRYLTYFGIEYLLKKYPSNMSSGERKLARISIGLSMERELTILDEPLINIDKQRKNLLVKLLNHEVRNVIMTTHEDDYIFYGKFNMIAVRRNIQKSRSELYQLDERKNAFSLRVKDEKIVEEILKRYDIEFEIEDGNFLIQTMSENLIAEIFPFLLEYRRVLFE